MNTNKLILVLMALASLVYFTVSVAAFFGCSSCTPPTPVPAPINPSKINGKWTCRTLGCSDASYCDYSCCDLFIYNGEDDFQECVSECMVDNDFNEDTCQIDPAENP